MEILKMVGFVIGILSGGYALFRTFIITGNDLKHLTADVDDLKKQVRHQDEKFDDRFEKISEEIAKLYTRLGAIEMACKINHGR